MVKKWALTKSAQYESVYKFGSAKSDYLVVVKKLANHLDHSRYGFSVRKSIGNAVKRNYVRRTLKEIARLAPIKEGFDIVFIARQNCGKADFNQISESTMKLLFRSGLLTDCNEMVNYKIN
jgi:ribonuclease P protein component